MRKYFSWGLKLGQDANGIIQSFKLGCAASVIHPKYAITASHCLSNSYKNDMKFDQLYVGACQPWESANGGRNYYLIASVEKKWEHPDRKIGAGTPNDIAVLKLSEPIDKKWLVAIADARFDADLCDNQEMTVYGMGQTRFRGASAQEVMKGELTYVKQDLCETAYTQGRITEDMLCATGLTDRSEVVDSCGGDAGGPLVVKTEERGPVLTGVVSWGYTSAPWQANRVCTAAWARTSTGSRK